MIDIHEAVYARYQEVHAGHCPGAGKRRAWMERFAALNLFPHISVGDYVLEIGCGPGTLLDVLIANRRFAHGSDLSPENIEKCRKDGYIVTNRNFFTDPDPDSARRYDAIVMMGVIEHIPKVELLTALRNLRSMLVPGGALIVTTQNMDAPIGTHYRYMDITHELGFTHESLAQVGRLTFASAAVYPMVYPEDPPTSIRHVLRLVRPLWKRLYRCHLRLMGTPVVDTWYDVVGLVGVFRA